MSWNPEETGVANPYALAEVIFGKKIPWREIARKTALLEEILGMSYAEIIHPRSGSPIFYAFQQAWDLEIRDLPERIRFGRKTLQWLDPYRDIERLESMADLRRSFSDRKFSEISIQKAKLLDKDTLRLELKLPQRSPTVRWGEVIQNSRISKQFFLDSLEPIGDPNSNWDPPSGSWGELGDFFQEAAEFHDPVQGIVGDCYLIAALGSVAWAMPFEISHRTRATGETQPEYMNMVTFHGENGTTADVEVSSTVPLLDSSGAPYFARSSEEGESWPAILEKAYAKWVTGHQGDQPDLMQLAGGSPFKAIQHLTGMEEWHDPTSTHSADDLWQLVRSNSLSRRTFLPMAACTSSEYLINQEGGTYVGSGIVPGHAYSVLGWDYQQGEKYIILRNPWGIQEPDIGVLANAVSFYDISWWRNIDLSAADGVFGLEVNVFKEYFSYLGGAVAP